MANPKLIAVDIDGVVADLGTPWLDDYNQDYDDTLLPDQIKSWAIWEFVKPECGRKVLDYVTPALYDRVEPIPGALEGCAELRSLGYDLVFVTSCINDTEGAKRRWLIRHKFMAEDDKNFVATDNKALVNAGTLIDDGLHNIVSWPNLGYLFDAHHNRSAEHNPGIQLRPGSRVYGWKDVIERIRRWEAEADLVQKRLRHPTERRSPNQVKRFKELLNEMYRVHLDKNADYSPANILGTGMIGCLVRLWDKQIRLMNLMGFDIEARLVAYTGPKQAKNESVADTMLDLANYAIIARLLWEGKWGN